MGTTKKVTIELDAADYSSLKAMSSVTGKSSKEILLDAIQLFREGSCDYDYEDIEKFNETFTKTLSKLGYKVKPENQYKWLIRFFPR